MSDRVPFKVAFPIINLPENYGGKRAIVIFALSRPADPNVCFALCVDIEGQVHQHVPVSLPELRLAAQNPAKMIECEGIEMALSGGSGLIGPNGSVL
jgi:hypothetical protein